MTPPSPTRATLEGRTYNDLRNLARRSGRDPAEYFTLYALEGFLSRLTASQFSQDFVVKGGVLLAAFALRRPTRDIDLSALGFSNDVAEVVERVATIATTPVQDGLTFQADAISGSQIRDEEIYAGVRVKIPARLATARVPLHVDVNFGDPIWPGPALTEVPRLLGGTMRLSGYPVHMVLAEKIVTALERGELNTRWRDFVDISLISKRQIVSGVDLRKALEAVARHRAVPIGSLSAPTADLPDLAQRKWEVWRRKQRLESLTPRSFGALLSTCLTFADPILQGDASDRIWNPTKEAWE